MLSPACTYLQDMVQRKCRVSFSRNFIILRCTR